MENKSKVEDININNYSVEVVQSISVEEVEQAWLLFNSIVPDKMHFSLEDFKWAFGLTDGVHILVRDNDNKIVGLLTSVPKDQEYEGLHIHDSEFTKDPNSLYVEAMGVKNSDMATLIKILICFIESAKKKDYQNISMHARVSQGLSDILQKRYGAKFFRRIENWYGFGEPFDYLELDLNNN